MSFNDFGKLKDELGYFELLIDLGTDKMLVVTEIPQKYDKSDSQIGDRTHIRSGCV